VDVADRTVTVYTSTRSGFPPMRAYLHDLWLRRPFIWHLARTDLKARHYDTVIGQLWILLDPILLAGVYYLLRTVVRPAGSEAERNALIVHLIMGICFFTYTSRSLTNGARSIVANQQMILNTSFPRAVFPIVSVMSALLDLGPTLIIVFGLQLVLGQPISIALICLPLLIAVLTVFNLGCALFFAPITVFFRDIGGFLPYITQVWLYTTPVLYTIAEIPENLRPWLLLNPLYPYWAAFEQMFSGEWPSFWYLLGALAWAIVAFVVGTLVFLVREQDFATRL
jgi:ABC-type polysaccharide/polyol phosphate export permease